MMEAQRQEESTYTLHSSALTINGQGILLLGHSGAGKTSVLLDLCYKFPSEIISNDLTFVRHNPDLESMDLVDGTKEIRLRLSSVAANFPHLIGLFPGDHRSPWESKIAVTPEDIGLKSAASARSLDLVFVVHVDSQGQDELKVYRETGIEIKYRLYEDMSRVIRGSAISVFGSDEKILGYIPSLDSAELHQKRVACIECMTDHVGVINISGGNLGEISEAISSITRSGF